MHFHDANGVIPPDAASDVLLAASVINLFLDSQNNCVRGESSTMETTGMFHGDPPLPVPGATSIFGTTTPPNTPICDYYVSAGATPNSVTG